MKKILLMMALMAIAPLALISCGDDDDDNGGSQETVLPTPAFKDDAVKLTLNSPAQLVLDGQQVALSRLELTESGNYLVAYTPMEVGSRATRAGGKTEYAWGKVSKAVNAYTLDGIGVVTITGKSAKTYVITVKTNGQDEVEAEATAANDVASGPMTDNLCRTWTVESTRLRITIDGKTFAKDFPGECDLNAILEYVKSQGVDVRDDIDDNSVVKGITFTRGGTYLIAFNRKTYDVGTWRWQNQATGALSYNWDDPSMGNSLEQGQATAEFVSGNKCKLALKGNVDGHDFELVYTMK